MSASEERNPDATVTRVRKTVAGRFNKFLIIFYIVCLLVSLPITYVVAERQVFATAEHELTLLVDMVRSVRNVVRKETRPHFLPKGEFFPPAVSSTVMAKSVSRQFAEVQPDYYIKIASDNPLNLENLPEPLEEELLNYFRQSGETNSVVQVGVIKDKKYLVSAAPAKAKEGCMICHGEPVKAPDAIVEKYGKINGYYWETGSIVGATVVGVPLADVKKAAAMRGLVVVGTLTLIFGVILVSVNVMVRRTVIQPLRAMNQLAKDISQGAVGNVLKAERDDEIGELAESLEVIRRTLEKNQR